MLLLLDTCTFLWLVSDPESLSETASAAITRSDNTVFLSAVSATEIAIKASLGKLSLPESPSQYIPTYRERHQIDSLAFEEPAALSLGKLPLLHRDPFDRMLVAQALTHGMLMVTPDPLIAAYPVRTLW